MASDKGITCDMSNVEFVGHVRDRCHLTIQNTHAGPYIEDLCGRLLMSSAERSRLRAENERLRAVTTSVANLAHHGGLVKDVDPFNEIRRITIPFWQKEECTKLQREALEGGGDDEA